MECSPQMRTNSTESLNSIDRTILLSLFISLSYSHKFKTSKIGMNFLPLKENQIIFI